MTDIIILAQRDRALLEMLPPNDALLRELDRAIVVSSEALPADVVAMNSRVVYSDETAGMRRLVTIVYPEDADESAGRISVLTPLGTALLGLSVGQAIDWDFPDGIRRTLRVDALMHRVRSTQNGDRHEQAP
ncbi:MAG TPA: nucleoside diphosphate kinase regulator [Burkholderiales bacterium]|nr:nucleoside diphosphate kinase regulator [Burkholderiales bacterium]